MNGGSILLLLRASSRLWLLLGDNGFVDLFSREERNKEGEILDVFCVQEKETKAGTKKKREIPSEDEILDLAKDETIQDGQSIDRCSTC